MVDRWGDKYHVCFSASSHEPGYQDELRNFSPVSAMRKGRRSWGRVLVPHFRTKQTWWNTKNLTFAPIIIASVTLKAVSLQLNEMLMMWKLQQTMQDDTIWTTRIHPTVHPGNWDEVFIWPISSLLGEISGTKPACPFIWTHQKFYKGFRSKARSWLPGQPGQPCSYEVGLKNLFAQTDIFRLNSTAQNQIYPSHMFRFYIQTSYINNSLQSSRCFFFTE